MPFEFHETELKSVIEITQVSVPDERGYFVETYKKSDFVNHGIELNFIQDNHSYSMERVLRGLHFQRAPYEQGKLVSVVSGEIFDVAVDIRPNSENYMKWYGTILSQKNNKMLWIPPGFAHGFQAIEDSHIIYKVTEEYSKDHDGGIRWDDPDVSVNWPISSPIISKKDRQLPLLREINQTGE